MALNVGDIAPEFELIDSNATKWSLDGQKGKNTVLLFFPFAYTSVCTTEMCDIRDNMNQYAALNADVVGISVDSPFTLAKFKADEALNFPLLSDFNKQVSQAYGAYYDEFVLGLKGVSKRSAFVIDGEGIIRYAEVLDIAKDIPNFAAIQDTLKNL